MKYVDLGQTDIRVSVLGLGCWPFAGDANWGPQDDADSIETVHAALDAGVSLFDTAEGYGAGRSEEVLGKALAGRRPQAVIATKVSQEHLSAEGIRAALRGKEKIAVLDRAVSLGVGGILCQEIKHALFQAPDMPAVFPFITGLGGMDVTPDIINRIFRQTVEMKEAPVKEIWVEE